MALVEGLDEVELNQVEMQGRTARPPLYAGTGETNCADKLFRKDSDDSFVSADSDDHTSHQEGTKHPDEVSGPGRA